MFFLSTSVAPRRLPKSLDKRLLARSQPHKNVSASMPIVKRLPRAITGFRAMRILFLDLPIEIRKKIYRYALIHDGPISVGYAYHLPTPYPTINGFSSLQREPEALWDGLLDVRHHVACGLLRSNRTVQTEAAPVFYGQNTIIVEGMDELYEWLQTTASSVQHLRQIVVQNSTLFKLSECLELLKPARNLQRLELQNMVKHPQGPKVFAAKLMPLLTALRDASAGDSLRPRRKDVSGVIHIPSTSRSRGLERADSGYCEGLWSGESYGAAVRGEVEKLLA